MEIRPILDNKKFHYIQKNLFDKVFASSGLAAVNSIEAFLEFEKQNSSNLNIPFLSQELVNQLISNLSTHSIIYDKNYSSVLTFLNLIEAQAVKNEDYIKLAKKILVFANELETKEIHKSVKKSIKAILLSIKNKPQKKFNKIKYLLNLLSSIDELSNDQGVTYKEEIAAINGIIESQFKSQPTSLIEILKHEDTLNQFFSILKPESIINYLTGTNSQELGKLLPSLSLLNDISLKSHPLIDKKYLKEKTALLISNTLKSGDKSLTLTVFNRLKLHEIIINPNKTGFINEIFSNKHNELLDFYFDNREQYQNMFPTLKEDIYLAKKYIQEQIKQTSINSFIAKVLAEKGKANYQLLILITILKNKEFEISGDLTEKINTKLVSIIDGENFYASSAESVTLNVLESLLSIKFNNFKFNNLNDAMLSLYSANNLFTQLLSTISSNKKDKPYTREDIYLKILNSHLEEINRLISSNIPQLLTMDLMQKSNFTNPLLLVIEPLVRTYKETRCFTSGSQHYKTYDLVAHIVNSFDNLFLPMEKVNAKNSILNFITQSAGFKASRLEEQNEIISKFEHPKFSSFENLIKTFFNKNAYQILINDKPNKFKIVTNKDDLIDEQQFLNKTKTWSSYQQEGRVKINQLAGALIEKKLMTLENNIFDEIYKNYAQIIDKLKEHPQHLHLDPEKVFFIKTIFFNILDKAQEIYTPIDISQLEIHNADKVKGALTNQLNSVNQELLSIYLAMTQEKETGYLKEIAVFDSYLQKKFKKTS